METEQLKQLLKEHVKQQKTTTGISNLLAEVFREAVQEMLTGLTASRHTHQLIIFNSRTTRVPLLCLSMSFKSIISSVQSVSYFSFMILIRFRKFSRPTE